MRMALTMGVHRSLPTEAAFPPIEREHRRRVWWTLYTLDRLCSSILGYPLLISDSAIDVELPSNDGLTATDQEEFADPAHVVANVKLARITGQIRKINLAHRTDYTELTTAFLVSDIYCLPHRSQENFVQRVHRVLLSLQKWDDELPQSLVLRQANLPRNVTSLHLHYNQCVISTTRPILLYLFKTRFSLNSTTMEATPRSFSSTTLALAESCVQAARASNSIL
jgi:proline utilization trans-activator